MDLSALSAKLYPSPPAMSVQSLSVPTCVGIVASVSAPRPPRPPTLEPQLQRVPSDFMPSVWLVAPLIWTQSLSSPTRVGLKVFGPLSPRPVWPLRLHPHAYNDPSCLIAKLEAFPVAIKTQSLSSPI